MRSARSPTVPAQPVQILDHDRPLFHAQQQAKRGRARFIFRNPSPDGREHLEPRMRGARSPTVPAQPAQILDHYRPILHPQQPRLLQRLQRLVDALA